MKKQQFKNGRLSKLQTSLIILSMVGTFAPTAALSVEAADNVITPANTSSTSVNTSGNVTNITTTKVIDGTAVNVFDKYQVAQGKVVNMWFGTQTDSNNANLVNLVNSKIDVNGTVNAVQNQKIGGHMYFLSSEGIAVGSSGVINAGSLTMMTPTSQTMKDIIKDGDINKDSLNKAMKGEIALNKEGTITVAGNINAHGNVFVAAGNSLTTESSSSINANVTDFSSLVNLEGAISGLPLNQYLGAVAEGEGNVTLLAQNVPSSNEGGNTYNATVTNKGTITALGDVNVSAVASGNEKSITLDLITQKYNAKVYQEGNIKAAGAVQIQAISDSFDRLADKTAQIDVSGQVTGKRVNIAATSVNTFYDASELNVIGTVTEGIGVFSGIELDADYSVVKNKAEVNIKDTAVITATDAPTDASALNISAGAEVTANLGSSSSELRLKRPGLNTLSAIPAASVTYLESNNNANVNIDGTLKSAGKTTIKAAAISNVDSGASVGTVDLTQTGDIALAAINVVYGTNNASVNISDKANLDKIGTDQNIKGALLINADATNKISAKADAMGSSKDFLATTVNVLNYDSKSKVNVNGAITAPMVNVTAKNVVTGNSMKTSNALADMIAGSFKQQFLSSKTFAKIMDKIFGSELKVEGADTVVQKLKDYATAGVSVGVANESFTSDVVIGNKANIQGKNIDGSAGDIGINAATIINDTAMNTTGTLIVGQKSGEKVGVEVAVQVVNLHNDSKVTLEGGSETQHAVVAGKNVNIATQSTMEYHRPEMMVAGVVKMANAIYEALSEDKENFKQSDLDELKSYIEAMENAGKDIHEMDYTADDLEAQAGTIGKAHDTFLSKCGVVGEWLDEHVKGTYDGVQGLYATVIAFANPNSYANFSAYTTNKSAGENTKLSLSGSLNINHVYNNSNVLIGKNAALTAKEIMNVKAATTAENVNFTGDAGSLFLPATTTGAGGGGSVAVQLFDNNSLVMVGENATLEGDLVNVEANDKLTQVGVVYSSGAAQTVGIHGLVNYMGGSSSSLISIDDEAKLKALNGTLNVNTLNVNALNDSTIVNIAGGFSKGGSISVGAGVAVTEYDISNYVAVGDNDADASQEEEAGDSDKILAANKVKQATKKAYELANFADEAEKAALLGSTAKVYQGELAATGIGLKAATSGSINTVGVAGSLTSQSDSANGNVFDNMLGAAGKGASMITNPITSIVNIVSNKTPKKVEEAVNGIEMEDMSPEAIEQRVQADEIARQEEADRISKFHLDIAGSGAINLLSGDTAVLADNIKFNVKPSSGKGVVQAEATDDLFAGAWAGAAAVNYISARDGHESKNSVGVSGAIGFNEVNRDIMSVLSNSQIINAQELKLASYKKGAEVAAGLGTAISAGANNNNVTVAANASINIINNNINSFLINNTQSVTAGNPATNITLAAESADTQVAGGLNVSVATGGKGTSVGGGLSVVYAQTNNDIATDIYGGTYNAVGNVTADAVLATTQVTAGVGVAVANGTGNNAKSGALDGAIAITVANNDARAVVDGATINSTTSDGKVAVRAYDENPGDSQYKDFLANRGIDAAGGSYVESTAKDTSTKGSEKENKTMTELANSGADTDYTGAINTALGNTGEAGGNVVVTGALAVAVTDGAGAGGIAIGVADINNDFTAEIKNNANITTAMTEVNAHNDSIVVNAVAGASGTSSSGKSFIGAGSVSLDLLDGDTQAKVSGSTINTDKLLIEATNNTIATNVAGQVSVGKVAAGMDFVLTEQDSTTIAELLGSTVNPYVANTSVDVELDAANTTRIYSVGVGTAVSTDSAAVNGTFVVNKGNSDVKAIVDNLVDENTGAESKSSKLNKVKNVNVKAKDKTVEVAIAAGIAAGKGVSIGGAVAYNDVGGASTKNSKAKQNLTAAINNTALTTVTDSSIAVRTEDDANITAVGFGVSGSSKVAMEGVSAVSLINKNMQASLDKVTITKEASATKGADVAVDTASDAKIANAAVVIAGSGKVAGGVGVAVSRVNEDSSANIIDSTLEVKSAVAKSLAQPEILNIGVGIGGSGTAGIAGSFGVNIIDSDTMANIKNSTIKATGNVGAIAQSDDTIGNYSGSIAGAGTAAVGLAVTVNTIGGNTNALVEDSIIEAKGNETSDITVASKVNDDALSDGIVTRATWGGGETLKDARQNTSYKGFVIDASSTHYIHSDMISAGGSGTVDVMGTVNVNTVSGSTTAQFVANNRGSIDNDKTGDFYVKAADYTDATAFVGEAGGSGAAAIGGASDAEVIDRDVTAQVIGIANSNPLNIKSGAMSVDAVSKQGISSLLVGGQVGGSVGIGAGVSVIKLKGETKASVIAVNADTTSLEETARHYYSIGEGNNNLGGGFYVGVGAGVSVITDENSVETELSDSTVTAQNNVKVTAEDKKAVFTENVGVGGALEGLAVAANVSVNNFENNVSTKVTNSSIQAGKTIDVGATNHIEVKANGGVLGLAAVGVGVGVVVNTINTSTGTEILNSRLKALDDDIKIHTEEFRQVDGITANAAVGIGGIGVNVFTASVGKNESNAVQNDEEWRQTINDDIVASLVQANAVQTDAQTGNPLSNTLGLTTEERNALNASTKSTATQGTGKSNVHTTVTGGEISSIQGNADITSNIVNKGYIGGGGGVAGGISVNVSINTEEIHNNLYTTVNGTNITGKDVNIDATIGGTNDDVKVLTGQGSLGGLNVTVSNADVESVGAATVNVTNAGIIAANNVNITSKDLSTVKAEVYGITVGGIDANAVLSKAENNISNKIELGGTATNQSNSIKAGNSIKVATERKGKVTSYALGGVGGGAAGIGVTADAISDGHSTINVAGGGSRFDAPNINMQTVNAPLVSAEISNGSGAVFAVQIATATGVTNLYSDLNIADNNFLIGNTVNLGGVIGSKDILTNTVTTFGVGAGLEEVLPPNKSVAQGLTRVNVNVGNEGYKTDLDGVLTNLNISGENNFSQKAETNLYGIGAIFTVANSRAEATADNQVIVNATQGGAVKNLTVTASGDTAHTVRSWGDSGGALDISPVSAKSTSTIDNTTTANVGGSWSVSGEAKLNAVQNDKVTIYVDTDNGGLIDVAGAEAENNLTDNTKVNFGANASVTADSVTASAKNSLATNENENSAEGIAGGLGAGNNITSKANIKTVAEVALDSAKVVTNNSQTYEAYTRGQLKNNVKGAAYGAVVGTTASSINVIDVTNKVSSAAGSDLKAVKYEDSEGKVNSITMAASDDLTLEAKTTAETGAVAAGVTAKSDNTTIRKADINVAGSIYSAGDTNLYAGANATGKASNFEANLEANAYTHAAIAVPLTDFDNNVTEYNQVNVAGTGKVNSIRNVNLLANSGREALRLRTVQYAWYWGDNDERTFVGNANGQADYGQTTDNYVKVDGTVNAGLENDVTITLAGKKAPVSTTFEDGSEGGYTIDVESGEYTKDDIRAGIQEGTFDYSNALFTRYEELNKLIAEYQIGEDENLTAYYGYKAEQASIINQMKELNMVEEHTSNGVTVYSPIKKLELNYIALPDIIVSGGNVVVSSDNLGGTGSIETQGTPKITVENTSDAYLLVGNLTVGGDGGRIIYKDNDIADKSDAEINQLNIKDDFANFDKVSAGDSSAVSAISVNTDYTGGAYTVKPDQEYFNDSNEWDNVKDKTATFTPITTIEINGLVTNEAGSANITNKSGSINIQAGGNNTKAGVVAKAVTINASGSVNQGYVEGIVNVGGAPEVIYKEIAQGMEAQTDKSSAAKKDISVYNGASPTVSDNSSWIAGGSVYISASDINVNGLVQSGYDNYYVNIDTNALDNLSSYDKTIVNGVSVYKLNDGGKAVYNSDKKVFDYLVQAYYDPSTNKILIEDICTSGGSIYLTGNISSTGNGKLVAANGGAKINVENKTSTAMDVGSIINSNREGQIVINDLAKGTETVYTPTSTVVTEKNGNKIYGHSSSSYAVQAGLRYNWTEGFETTTKKTYENEVKDSWWGAMDGKPTEEELKKYEENSYPANEESPVDEPKLSGVYIAAVDGVNPNTEYSLIYDNILDAEQRSDVEQWTTSTGFIGFYKHHHYRWTTTQGSVQTYVNSVKADYDIGVKFIGGMGEIAVSGAGDVNLNGNIAANMVSDKTTITSQQGSINQAGATSITGNEISLSANNGINNINVISMAANASSPDVVNLKAETTNGSADVTVTGGIYNNTRLEGNVNVEALKGAEAVSLIAAGNITQIGNNVTVAADKINLVSLNGGIGTDTQRVIVKGGQNAIGEDGLSASVSASALKDIYMAQNSGDMRIGKIISKSGDVNLEAQNGKFIDALPNEDSTNNDELAARIQNWKDMGLIEGEGIFTRTLAQDRLQYETNAKTAFAQYQELKAYYATHENEPRTEAYNKLDELFGGFSSAEKYLENDSKYQKLMEAPEYKWTEEALLYSIKDSVINKTVGSTDNEKKAANISGKNVILTGIGVGTNDDAPVSLDLNHLTTDDLKLLSNANAADVDMNLEKGTAVINGKRALGINATEAVTLNVTDNAYISSRSLEGDALGSGPLLTINQINADGDVRVLGKTGVVANSTDANRTADITANGLYLEGGTGDIGAADNALRLNLQEAGVGAITEGSIYLQNAVTAPLYLGAMNAGKDIAISAGASDILMSPLAPDAAYLRAGVGEISFVTTGNVGAQDGQIRIYNGDANSSLVAIETDGNIYLKGMNGTSATGTMSVKKAVSNNGTVELTSEGGLIVGKEDDETAQGGFEGKVEATKGNVTLTAKDDIVLDGQVKAGSDKTVTLTSTEGALTQLDNADSTKNIAAQRLVTVSSKGVNLQNTGNNFSAASFSGTAANDGTISGDVTIHTNHANSVTLDGNDTKVDGDVMFTNGATGAGLNIATGYETINGHSIAIDVEGTLHNDGILKSDKDVELISKKNVENNGTLTAKGNIIQNAGTAIANTGALTAGGALAQTAGTTIANAGTLTSGETLAQTAGTAINNNGTLVAGSDIKLAAQTGITNAESINATKGSITMHSVTGVINNTNAASDNGLIKAGQAITMTAESVTNARKLASGGATMLTATNGNIEQKKDIDSEGAVKLSTATGNITVAGNIDSESTVEVTAQGVGTIDITGSVTGKNNVTLETKDTALTAGTSAIKTGGNITSEEGSVAVTAASGNIGGNGDGGANDDVLFTAVNGDIVNDGNMTANGDVLITAISGNVSNNGTITSQSSNVKVDVKDGNFTNGNDIHANLGSVMINAQEGQLDVAGKVTAKQDITLNAKNDINTQGSLMSGGNIMQTSTTGSLVNDGFLVAGNDISLEAQQNITNEKSIISTGGSVEMLSHQGDILNDKATEIGFISAAEDINMTTENGTIYGKGTVESGGITKLAATNGGILQMGNLNSEEAVNLSSTNGDIVVEGAITSNDTVDVTTQGVGVIDIEGSINGKNDVTLTAENTALNNGTKAINNTGEIRSQEGNVKLQANSGDIDVKDSEGAGNVIAANDAIISTTNGRVYVDGSVEAGRDAVISTEMGNVIIGLDGIISQDTDVMAGRDVIINTNNQGALLGTTAGNGNVFVYGNMVADNNVQVDTKVGNIFVIGDIEANHGQIQLNSAQAGSVINSGDIVSKEEDIAINVKSGNFVNGSNISSENGAVQIAANDGLIDIGGNVTALTDIAMQAKNGINTGGIVKAGGDIVQTITGDGTIINADGVDAGGSLTEEIMGTGNLNSTNVLHAGKDLNLITHNGSVNVELPGASSVGGNLNVVANNGNASVNGALLVGNDIKVETTNGDVEFAGLVLDATDTSNINLKATDGNINNNVKIITAGSISETIVNKGNINNADLFITGGDVYQLVDGDGSINNLGSMAVGGNLTKAITGTGDVLVDEMITYVKGDITFSTNNGMVKILNDTNLYTKNGTITLAAGNGPILANSLNGENVVIKLGTEGRTALVGTTTVGTKLSFEGDNFIEASIQQREGYTNPLHISAVGINGQQAMKNFILPEVLAPNGLVIDELWTNRAYVDTTSPELKLERLNVETNGYFFTPYGSATIYGQGGRFDRLNNIVSDAIYAKAVHNPWMKLYLLNNGTQFSDALLLYKESGTKVYNQRFSAVDESFNILTEENPKNMFLDYTDYNYPGQRYGTYWRYDLIDDSEMTKA